MEALRWVRRPFKPYTILRGHLEAGFSSGLSTTSYTYADGILVRIWVERCSCVSGSRPMVGGARATGNLSNDMRFGTQTP